VRLKTGEKKAIQDIQIGDEVLTMNKQNQFQYSPVLMLPHPMNTERSEFLEIQTAAKKTIRLTPDHLLLVSECSASESSTTTALRTPSSASYLLTAKEIEMDRHCLLSVEGWEVVSSVQKYTAEGVYTLITKEEYLVISQLIASPFAINHEVGNWLYFPLRAMYSIMPQVIHHAWIQQLHQHIAAWMMYFY
jgi:hypothetical protein